MLAVLLEQLLNSKAKIDISMPKYFSESIMTFFNFQLYKNSILGKIDPRSKEQILDDTINTVKSKFDNLVKKKIFILNDDDTQYKLNLEFDTNGKILLNNEQYTKSTANVTRH